MTKLCRIFFFLLCMNSFVFAGDENDCLPLSFETNYLSLVHAPQNLFLRGWSPSGIIAAHELLTSPFGMSNVGARLEKTRAVFEQLRHQNIKLIDDPLKRSSQNGAGVEGVYASIDGTSLWNKLAAVAFLEAGLFIEFTDINTLQFNRLTGNVMVPVKSCPQLTSCMSAIRKVEKFIDTFKKNQMIRLEENGSASAVWRSPDRAKVKWLEIARRMQPFRSMMIPLRPDENESSDVVSLKTALLTPVLQRVYTPQQFAIEFGKSGATINGWVKALEQFDLDLENTNPTRSPSIFLPQNLDKVSVRIFLSRSFGEELSAFGLTLAQLNEPDHTMELMRKKFKALVSRSQNEPVKIFVMRGSKSELPVDAVLLQWVRLFINHELRGMLDTDPKIDVYAVSNGLSPDVGRLLFVSEVLSSVDLKEDIFQKLK